MAKTFVGWVCMYGLFFFVCLVPTCLSVFHEESFIGCLLRVGLVPFQENIADG